MGWRHVLFANWAIDPETLADHLPAGLEPDTYDGEAYLSVVPFTNVHVRPKPLPRAAGVALPELNLRTYVRLADRTTDTSDGGRDPDPTATTDTAADEGGAAARSAGGRGVYFFSLDADGLAGVIGARVTHDLPYYYAAIALSETDGVVRFRSRRRHPGARSAPFEGRYEPVGEQFHADPESLAAFLTDRDRYYTETPGGELRTADVRHEQWPLYRAEATLDADGLFRANGFRPPDDEPTLLYSPRVETTASSNRPV